jgi:transposase InsO family protein
MLTNFLHTLWLILISAFRFLFRSAVKNCPRRKHTLPTPIHGYKQFKKPDWVIQEVIRIKAFMPGHGCRKIADCFNQLFEHHRHTPMTIGKSFVSQVIKQHQYDIHLLRQQTRHRIPKAFPSNMVWAVDLTTVTDTSKHQNTVYGVLDHGSRACLLLKTIPNKSSVILIRALLDCIELYGKPKYLRSDNEAVFVSHLFRFCLWLLGIKNQRIPKYSPWCNGRIERFFGTFKERINQLVINDTKQLSLALPEFRFWYNHVRTHQHLQGKTPAQVWSNTTSIKNQTASQYFSTWDGLLTGFYFPPPE